MDEMDREAVASKTDKNLRNDFIAESGSFIQRCAYRAVGHYVSRSDDEWSVALIAFDEAITRYDPEKGPFAAFAGLVIRRRMTDRLRAESKYAQEVSVEPYVLDGQTDEEPTALQLEVVRTSAQRAEQVRQSSAKDEIEAMQGLLQGYGFSFFALAEASPKSEKTRRSCAQAVNTLLAVPGLLEKLRSRHTLPIQELAAESAVSKKLLDRHRRYIIAAAEILDGDYPHLAEYLGYIRKAVGSS